jgi:hypothetical protein
MRHTRVSTIEHLTHVAVHSWIWVFAVTCMGRFIQLPVPPTPLLRGATDVVDATIATSWAVVGELGWPIAGSLVEHPPEVHVL